MTTRNEETAAEEHQDKDANGAVEQETPGLEGENTSHVQMQLSEEVVPPSHAPDNGVVSTKSDEPKEPPEKESIVSEVAQENPETGSAPVTEGSTEAAGATPGELISTMESNPVSTENGADGTGATILGLAAEQMQNVIAENPKESPEVEEENGDSKPAAEDHDSKQPTAPVASVATSPVKGEEAEDQTGGMPSLEASRIMATDPTGITAETLVVLKTGPDGQTVAVVPPLQPPKHIKKGEILKRPQNTTTVVTRNGKTWNEMFEALVAYKEEHGDCYVPDRYKNDEGVCLGLWVRNQRRREESLTADQHKRLSDLGLDWQTQNERFDSVWHERYAKLTMYRVEHGDCKVPYTYKADPALAKWVSQQRAQQAQGRLAPDRKAKLDAIDFSWKLNTVKNRNTKTEDKKWMRQYDKLVAFHVENGHCKVPDRYKPDRPLGTWVKKQRLANACNQLKEDRKKMLDDLGFVWRITDKTDAEKWDKMFQQLKEYKEDNGTCHVSRTVPDSDLKPLARWVKTQRALYKSNKILPDRKARLETIDFVWDGTQLPIKRKRRRPNEEEEKSPEVELPAKKSKTEEHDDEEDDKKPAAVEDVNAKTAPEKKGTATAKRVLPTSSQKSEAANSQNKGDTEGGKAGDDESASQGKPPNGNKAEEAVDPMDTTEAKATDSSSDAIMEEASGNEGSAPKAAANEEKSEDTKDKSSAGDTNAAEPVSPLRQRSVAQTKPSPSKADGESTEEEDEEGDTHGSKIIFI